MCRCLAQNSMEVGMGNNTMLLLAILFVIDLIFLISSLYIRRIFYRQFTAVYVVYLVSIVVNIIILSASNQFELQILEAIYYLSIAIAFLLTFQLVSFYTVHNKKMARRRLDIFVAFTVVDAILLFTNPITGWMFKIENVADSSEATKVIVLNIFPGIVFHFGVCTIIGFFCLIPLFYKGIHSRGMYRLRYFGLCAILMAVAFCGYVTAAMNYNVGLVIFVMMISTLITQYFIEILIPQRLTQSTMGLTLNSMDIGLAVYDLDGMLVFSNDRTYDLLKIPRNDTIKLKEWADEWVEKKNLRTIKEEQVWELEEDDSTVEKKKIIVKTHFLLDKKGNEVGGYFQIYDKTEEHEKFELEHYKATHDYLTGLYNREGFYEIVRQKLNENPYDKYMIVCTDVREFKMINDLFGYEKGDEIIKKMAAMLSMGLERGDVAARMVADEFALFVRKETYDEKYLAAQIFGITEMVTNNYYTMTIHCGLFDIRNPEMDVSLMCDRAMIALGTVRDDTDNKVVHYSDTMLSNILRDRQIAGRLDSAMKNGEFEIFLQAQARADGSIMGAEALVRWNDPQKGYIPPGDFIEILEQTGCLYRLDQYVWELAAKLLAKWKNTPRENLHISVNISPNDFYYLDLYETFTSLVKKYHINPGKLKLEITENALMNDEDKQLKLINKMHDFGFMIEIDDFGSGYSSLSMLKDIPADVLKIDMGFLRETENQERSRAILNSVISLAKELGMEVITEGVEKKSQVEYLESMGCHEFQGYYFSKPVSIDEFEEKYPM